MLGFLPTAQLEHGLWPPLHLRLGVDQLPDAGVV